jgi:antirestriction protein ArdC
MVDKFQEITNRIIALLERGVKPWQRPWSATEFQNLLTGHHYQGWNPLICAIDMALYGYQYPLFVGAGQAKAKGWKFKKGSKSTWIKYASTVTKQEEKDDETIDRTFSFCKWLQLFNVDCLDDSEAEEKIQPLLKQKLKNLDKAPEPKIEEVEQFIQSHNPTIGYGGDRACYVPAIDKIQMPHYNDFHTREGYYATLLHELTHWTGHPSRLNRPLGNGFATQAYAFEELIAELGASYLCSQFEINSTIEHHASYIDSWLKVLKQDKKALFNAMKEANKACEFLLAK